MPLDPQVLAQQAGAHNIVPSVVWALGESRQAWGGDDFENEVHARSIAREIARAVETHGTIEKALAVIQTGDPNVADSPTHPGAGAVQGVLGLAGSRADLGMGSLAPSDPHAFAQHAGDVHAVFDSLASLGGVVTAEVVQRLGAHIQRLQPAVAGRPSQQSAKPHPPSGPRPQDVGTFQAAAAALGVTAEHIIQHFEFASTMTRKLQGKNLSLDDYAPMAQQNMGRSEIQQHINNLPHPLYPEVTTGQYHQAYNTAALHSWKVGAMPHPAEALSFASLGSDVKQIAQYYEDQAKAKGVAEVTPKPADKQGGAK